MATATITREGLPVARRGDRATAMPIRHIDVPLLVVTLLLTLLGIVMVYSATRGPGGPGDTVDSFFLQRQALFAGIGIVAMIGAATIDYRRLRALAAPLYFGMVLLLALVLSPVGSESKGTQAWFDLGSFQLQPSEFGKIALILALAAYCSFRGGELRLRHLIVVLIIAGLPLGLILLQPDLGTALVFVAITTGVLLVGGARPRHILAVTLIGVLGVLAIFNSDVLADYQLDRFSTFIDPQSDVQGTTWNVDQSQTAIGAGGLTGQGLYQGRQTRSGQVPEQHTDFIFTVVGEELGFVGAAGALLLFGFLMWRIWRTALISKDLFGTLLCVGVMSMFVFQLFQSAGMTMNIMPVTGIPLPLMSYGGSSMITSFIAIGLVLNVHMRRFQ